MTDDRFPKRNLRDPFIRLVLFGSAFAIIMYMLRPVFPEVFVSSMIGALVVAALLILCDMLVMRLWRRTQQRPRKPTERSVADLSRRQFMARMAAPSTAAAVGGIGLAGTLAPFTVHHERVHLPHLPRGLDGFRIGLITDPHIGTWSPPKRLARAVDLLNDAQVHLQLMGGDLVDDLSLIAPTFSALERSRAPYGMLAVLGNHEKMGHQLPPILAAYEQRSGGSPLHLLVDSNVRIEHQGTALSLVGVDYPMHPGGSHVLPPDEHQSFMRASAEKAFHGINPDDTTLCLSHHPDFFPIAAEHGAQVTLAGHTHGGQWAILGHPLLNSFKYMRGRYRLGPAHLYVSCGFGDWLPCRIGVPTEVTILTLTQENS